MNNLIKSALISEKSFVGVSASKFVFIVSKDADKETVAHEIESLFGVNVIDVNTANFKGKIKASRKGKGRRSDFKKAFITLKAGQKINLFDLETPEQKEEKAAKAEKKTKKVKSDTEAKNVEK